MGNLVYCIRAGCIEDAALMDSVSNDEMVDFFLYVKEVHRIVADTQSLERGSLVKVVTVNDLYGVSLLSGEKRFRDALSSSSKIGSSVFPELNSVTMLLNLPLLLNAIVGLFKPIFPATVRAKLRFKSGPLGKSVGSLSEVAPGGEKREIFLGQLADLLKEE
uniref:CRAL-TRIO domain-containing protein n=1 Tax=Corethron hystrix TaxID=216773 RepID=A0A7S1FUN1_9STRA|mmetsp:Transcript_29887/g.68571  ORF Transcript_29887/g.68571 Transcript_29887/m.68571 type:complete len:162 (+) Transcript_29887:471-956(+)